MKMLNKKGTNFYFGILKVFFSILKSMPILFCIYLFLNLMHGTSWAFETLAKQYFFDNLQEGIVQGNSKGIYQAGIILGFTVIYVQAINGVANFVGIHVFSTKAKITLTERFHERVASFSLYDYEKEDTLEIIEKAGLGIDGVVKLLMITISALMFNLPYIIFISLYLYHIDPVLVWSILAIFVPLFISQLLKLSVNKVAMDKKTPYKREYSHYSNCIIDKMFFKETRVLGAVRYFIELYKSAMDKYNYESWRADFKTNCLELVMRILTLLGYIVVIILLVRSLLKGNITAGAFVAVFSSIDAMFRFMENLISRSIGSIAKNMPAVINYVKFMTTESEDFNCNCDITTIETGDVVFENVSFIYPNSSKPAISNLTIKVKKGETIAIVGENGSGKSTFVKLAMGLYPPSAGNVYINGVNTKNRTCLPAEISAVFQNFQKYMLTLGENIAISDTGHYSVEKICEASNHSNLPYDNVKLFPKQFDTLLGREFNGIDLSIGQWQRIAISRGLYRNHNIIALDEPTASIDPIEETRILNMFRDITQCKTALLVTHRIGSAKIADRVLLFDKGKIIGEGTHAELLSKNAIYAYIYNEQAKWY